MEKFNNFLIADVCSVYNWTKKDLAFDLNVTLKTISNYDTGFIDIPPLTKKYLNLLIETKRLNLFKQNLINSLFENNFELLQKIKFSSK